jgi:DNA replication protein DnaC
VLFIRTTDFVQRLQVARRDLELEAAISKLDKYQLLILDDIAYVTKDQAETSVLFELIASRYERRSLLITANDKLEVVADRGYFNGEKLLACEQAGIEVTLPKPLRDVYRCPAGEHL